MTLDDVKARVAEVLKAYGPHDWGCRDPEDGHVAEDALLWSYVQARADEGDERARLLLTLRDDERLDRWYS